jgi:hypothetical protein
MSQPTPEPARLLARVRAADFLRAVNRAALKGSTASTGRQPAARPAVDQSTGLRSKTDRSAKTLSRSNRSLGLYFAQAATGAFRTPHAMHSFDRQSTESGRSDHGPINRPTDQSTAKGNPQ